MIMPDALKRNIDVVDQVDSSSLHVLADELRLKEIEVLEKQAAQGDTTGKRKKRKKKR